MHSYFLSDLHLSPEHPEISAAFIQFLTSQAPSADKVYILGDLFEYWIGDDATQIIGADPILDAMKLLSEKTPCYFVAGNRDFLVRQGFSELSGFKILPDETVIDLYGSPTLILHGDSLCTDDIKHQQFRENFVLNKMVCDLLLTKPLHERLALAQKARSKSQSNNGQMNENIMDVTEAATIKAFKTNNVQQMIHGHTHRQNVHTHDINGVRATRYVLGDWHTSSSILTATPTSIQIDNLEIKTSY